MTPARLLAGRRPVCRKGGAPATGVTWHRIPTVNGWRSADFRYGTGIPSWAVKGGIVYLSGSVLLPPSARPSHKLWMTAWTSHETSGTLAPYPSGRMFASSVPAASFTSLADVSYPVASSAQHRLRPGRAGRRAVHLAGDDLVPAEVITGASQRAPGLRCGPGARECLAA